MSRSARESPLVSRSLRSLRCSSESGFSCRLSRMTSISRMSLLESVSNHLRSSETMPTGLRVLGELLELRPVDVEPIADLLVGRLAAELHLERLAGSLDLGRARAHEPRHPVHRPQLVEDRAADALGAIRLELHAPIEIERVDRVHQAEQAGGHQVLDVHLAGQPHVHALGRVAHEVEVVLDEAVAKSFASLLLVDDPRLGDPVILRSAGRALFPLPSGGTSTTRKANGFVLRSASGIAGNGPRRGGRHRSSP